MKITFQWRLKLSVLILNYGNRDRLFLERGGGFKITADCDCSRESKRCLLLGRTALTNLESILTSRDIIFANKGPFIQSYGFSSSRVWM